MELLENHSKKISVSLEERVFIELCQILLGQRIEKSTLNKLSLFIKELEKWNKVHNLTSAKSRSEILFRHVIDSLFFFRCLSDLGLSAKNKNIIDIGSGAGFPGIIIALFEPQAKVFLVESRKKKAAFLKFISAEISLDNTVIINERVEKLEKNTLKEAAGKLDFATSRASMQFGELLKKAERILNSDSTLLVWSTEEEAKQWHYKTANKGNWSFRVWSAKDFIKQAQKSELVKESELKLFQQIPETAIILCKKVKLGEPL